MAAGLAAGSDIFFITNPLFFSPLLSSLSPPFLLLCLSALRLPANTLRYTKTEAEDEIPGESCVLEQVGQVQGPLLGE